MKNYPKTNVCNVGRNFICTFFIVFVLCAISIPKLNNNNQTGSSAYLYDTSLGLRSYYYDKCKKSTIKDFKATMSDSATCLESDDYSQDALISYYNTYTNTGDKIVDDQGVCWVSAMASVLTYEKATTHGKKVDGKVIGLETIEYAMENKWISSTSTYFSSSHNVAMLKHLFGIHGKAYKVSSSSNKGKIFTNVKSQVDSNKLALVSIPNHLMVGCGYTTCEITYKQKILGKWKDKVVTENVLICNPCNDSNAQFAYYPEMQIKEDKKYSQMVVTYK